MNVKSFLRRRKANTPNATKIGIDMMKEQTIDEFKVDAIGSPDSLLRTLCSDAQLRMEMNNQERMERDIKLKAIRGKKEG